MATKKATSEVMQTTKKLQKKDEEKSPYVFVTDDCIHLKACRRLMKIANANGCRFSRGCTPKCSAYEARSNFNDGRSFVTVEQAIEYARDGVQMIRGGYDAYDVYCTWELAEQAKTLDELLDEI